ncbi:MAG TPA: T9SS type A sorting domain-containing protein [Ignavibacteriales bacterium]|nr:T9SS type A sorting domain-containing protein [Ignavibacteriales bacterium]
MKSLLTAILLFITILNYAQETSRPDELIPNAGYEAYQDPNGEPVYKRSVIKAYGGDYYNNGMTYSDSVLFNSKGVPLVEYLYDPGIYTSKLKYVYSYNEKGLKTTDEAFRKNGTDWSLLYKEQYFYNSEDLLDSIIRPGSKTYYKYEDGKTIKNIYNSGPQYRWEYDKNGRLIYKGWYYMGSSGSDTYKFDDLGRLIMHLVRNGGLYNISDTTKYNYEEDSLGRTIKRTAFLSSFTYDSMLVSTEFYAYNEAGLLHTYEKRDSEKNSRSTYEYGQNGDVLSNIYEERTDAISEWKPVRKYEYAYNELGQLIKHQIYDYDSSGVWINSIYGISAIIPGTDVKKGFARIEYAYTRIDTIIGINDREEFTPAKFSLAQNYPNPFNPETKISFNLPASGKASLKVYDMLGREVAELLNGEMEKGPHSVSFNGRNLSSGVYIYRLQSGNFTESKKMMLIK